jgi:hypothetical protein
VYLGAIDRDPARGTVDRVFSSHVQRLLRPVLTRPIAFDGAVDATSRRWARVYAPRYVGFVIALHGVLQPLSDLGLRRICGVALVVERTDEASRAPHAGPDPALGGAASSGTSAR